MKKYRIAINRSNKLLTAQVIDDVIGKTVISVSKNLSIKYNSKKEQAQQAGMELASLIKKNKITSIYVDIKKYRYHGRIKLFIDTLRKNGVEI